MCGKVVIVTTTTARPPLRGVNPLTIRSHIRQRNNFSVDGSFLAGETLDSPDYGLGRLPAEYWGDFDLDSHTDDFYTVRSLGTPIAWHANKIWHAPNVLYDSVTTTRHQAIIGCDFHRVGIDNFYVGMNL
jgi:hypothetical protein